MLPNSVEHEALLVIKSEINYDPNHVLSSWNDSDPFIIVTGKVKLPKRVVGIYTSRIQRFRGDFIIDFYVLNL